MYLTVGEWELKGSDMLYQNLTQVKTEANILIFFLILKNSICLGLIRKNTAIVNVCDSTIWFVLTLPILTTANFCSLKTTLVFPGIATLILENNILLIHISWPQIVVLGANSEKTCLPFLWTISNSALLPSVPLFRRCDVLSALKYHGRNSLIFGYTGQDPRNTALLLQKAEQG